MEQQQQQTVASVSSPSPGLSPPPPPAPTASPSFPPSPPSSCGDQSPPPKSLQDGIPLLSSSPSAPNKVPPPKPSSSLPFSIENILRPDFGSSDRRASSKSAFSPLSPEAVLRTPPKTPEPSRHNDSPVDLSHKKATQSGAPSPHNQTNETSSNTNITNSLTSTNSSSSSNNSNSNSSSSSTTSSSNSRSRYPENPEELANPRVPQDEMIWPAWVYCTRYSDRPSSGPRSRRMKRQDRNPDEKRPRTAFTSEQLSRLKVEFEENKYLTEKRRQELARELGLNESQIKIWFQNKRAKIKKSNGAKNGLAQHLMAQGLYNHSTMPVDEDDPYLN